MRWLNDRYRLDTPVGRGGMAVVWRGYDAVLRRTVAIKMLPDLADDDRSHERLRAEALAAAQLTHACIAGIYDYGEATVGWRRCAPYLVMEYVDGQTLATLLASGPMPWREAARICADIAAALAFAHARGLVHRDVKPGNVILSGSAVKVVDFGIATASGGLQSEDGGLILGTRAYMAPEQAADTPALPASDVYALGLVLRDCLLGKRERRVTDEPTEPAAVESTGPPLPSDVPAPVADLVTACLAQTPRARPTAAEATAVLHRAAGGTQAEPAVRAATPTADQPTEPAGRTEPAAPGRPRRLVPLPRSHRPRQRRVSVPQAASVATAAAVLAVPLALLPGIAPGDSTAGDSRASAGPTPLGPPHQHPADDCVARFSGQYLPNGTFTGVLDLTWTGARSLVPWSVTFALPAGQRLVGTDPGRLVQNQGTVSITSDQQLAPGQTISLSLRGVAADNGGAPRGFVLDGHTCTRSTSDVEATRTVPGPTRTVRVPDAGTTPDGEDTPDPVPTSAPPSTAPSTSPSGPEPSGPESTSDGPPSPDPSVTGSSAPAESPSPPDPQPAGTASATRSPSTSV